MSCHFCPYNSADPDTTQLTYSSATATNNSLNMIVDSRREAPFAPLRLTRTQRQHCQDITFQLLDRTLRNYDERSDSVDGHVGTPRHHANLDRGRWKQLKTQTNASLYAERASRSWRDLNLAVESANHDKRGTLLAVGTIDGSLTT